MKKEIFSKTLVMGILVILIGVGVYPAVAEVSISQESTLKNEEIDAKAYLFQTVIDISNNPSVKRLLEQSKDDFNNVFLSNIECNNKIKKILFEKHGLFFSMLFTKPSISHRYLDKVYDHGVELVNIIGIDEALEILESVHFTNQEFIDDLNDIIKNDETLSRQFLTLEEMNVLQSDMQSWPFPIICIFLLINWLYSELFNVFLETICSIFDFIPFVTTLYTIISAILEPIISIFYNLGVVFGCFWT